ncbi:hypothetical protein GCM10009681_21690 [Luedemannella helvata]|uniref:Uncharacterized protein n=1 Tax=Luedemannella helvata TaxID=349315 RepID=A0ABP4WAF1_9ACTN
MPKATSTPSDSSDRTNDCAPVRVSTAGTAGCWGRTPAATVSGDGAPVGGVGVAPAPGRDLAVSLGDFIASMPSRQWLSGSNKKAPVPWHAG